LGPVTLNLSTEHGLALTCTSKLGPKLLDRRDVISHHTLPDREIARAASMRLAEHSDGVAPA
jgi:hypothetical protein